MQKGLQETIEEKVHLQIPLITQEEGYRSQIEGQDLFLAKEAMKLGG
jgi:hypothetical protein